MQRMSLPVPVPAEYLPLNRSEHGYAAIEGLAGTMVQPYLLRLTAPIDETLVRAVARELLSAYPKLRAVLDPGWHRYRFRILPEGPLIDQLFELAFRVERHIDIDRPEAFEAWQRELVHEVLPLEHGLACRIRWVPHPQRPALALSVPHILADGMTMLQLVHQLLRGFNGMPVQPMPLEAPSMLGSIAPERWWQWPRQVWRSRQHKVAEARRLKALNIVQLPTRPGPHFGATGVCHHAVPTPTVDLRRAARQLGVSLNTFVVAGLAQTFLDQAPDDPRAAAVIRISVNLRRHYPAAAGHGPLWGNHVGAFLVIEQNARKPLLQRVRDVDASIKEGQARYARREMCWTYLLEELMPWLGRTAIGHIGVRMKRAGRFPVISCHATSLGDASAINPEEGRVRVAQIAPAVNSISPLPVLVELDGQLTVTMVWQQGETSQAEVADFMARLDQVLARMVAEACALGSGVQAGGQLGQPLTVRQAGQSQLAQACVQAIPVARLP